jgi:hypothetical protein
MEKEDAIEFTKIVYVEVYTGIFKAILNAFSSKYSILVSIGITALAEVITNSDGKGTNDLVKKRIWKVNCKI